MCSHKRLDCFGVKSVFQPLHCFWRRFYFMARCMSLFLQKHYNFKITKHMLLYIFITTLLSLNYNSHATNSQTFIIQKYDILAQGYFQYCRLYATLFYRNFHILSFSDDFSLMYLFNNLVFHSDWLKIYHLDILNSTIERE